MTAQRCRQPRGGVGGVGWGHTCCTAAAGAWCTALLPLMRRLCTLTPQRPSWQPIHMHKHAIAPALAQLITQACHSTTLAQLITQCAMLQASLARPHMCSPHVPAVQTPSQRLLQPPQWSWCELVSVQMPLQIISDPEQPAAGKTGGRGGSNARV